MSALACLLGKLVALVRRCTWFWLGEEVWVRAKSLKSCPTLATLWTIACQGPLPMEFSMEEYWSGLLCPPPGDLPNPGVKPAPSYVSCIDRWVLYLGATWEAQVKKVSGKH